MNKWIALACTAVATYIIAGNSILPRSTENSFLAPQQVATGIPTEDSNAFVFEYRFAVEVEQVVVIADFSKTIAPKLTTLSGEYLEAFVRALRGSDLMIVATGDSLQLIRNALLVPLDAALNGDDRELLKKLVIMYNTNGGALLAGTGEDLWLPEAISKEERDDFTIALIESFWERIREKKEALGLDDAQVDRAKEEVIRQYRSAITENPEWEKATSDKTYRYLVIPEWDGLQELLGPIFLENCGSSLCLEFNALASEQLEVAFGGNILNLTTRIAEPVNQNVQKRKMKFVTAGPTYVDIVQGYKRDGVLQILKTPQVRALIGKGKRTVVFLLGDSSNDTHLNLSDGDLAKAGIERAVAVPIFVGSNKELAEQFQGPLIETVRKDADGGCMALNAIAVAKGWSLRDTIVFGLAGIYSQIFADLSDTIAMPPGTPEEKKKGFPPHEIALRDLILSEMDETEARTFRTEAKEGYGLFGKTRRDGKTPPETSYGYWLTPFIGKLTMDHINQLVADWEFNPHFLEAVALIREALGIPPDETVKITVVSGNITTINRAFFEREEIARVLKEHHIQIETIQGVELVMEGGVFQGALKTVGTLFNAGPDTYPPNAFVIGDNLMEEKYGFKDLPLFINAQSLDPVAVRERLRQYLSILGNWPERNPATDKPAESL